MYVCIVFKCVLNVHCLSDGEPCQSRMYVALWQPIKFILSNLIYSNLNNAQLGMIHAEENAFNTDTHSEYEVHEVSLT